MIKTPEIIIQDIFGKKSEFTISEMRVAMLAWGNQFRWIKTTTGEFLQFDDQDYEVLRSQSLFFMVDRGHVCASWTTKNGKKTASPVAKLLLDLEGTVIIRYRDNNPFNLRRENIDTMDHQKAHFGQKKPSGKTSMYKGVSWSKFAKKWGASIKINYQKIHLGYFHEELDAAKEYNRAAIEKFGSEFAKLNVIPESPNTPPK